MCVEKCVCLGAVRERQRGKRASQDACPIVALVVFSSEASPRVMGLQSNLSTGPPVSQRYLFQLMPRGRPTEIVRSLYVAYKKSFLPFSYFWRQSKQTTDVYRLFQQSQVGKVLNNRQIWLRYPLKLAHLAFNQHWHKAYCNTQAWARCGSDGSVFLDEE